MSVKKGIDRLSIVFAIIVMVGLTSAIVVIGWTEGFASFGNMVLVISGAAILSILGTLFGIRGIAYITLWIIQGFKDEKDADK